MAGVDLVNDLEMPGEDVIQHGHRPPLQGLREEGVVCVGEGLSADVPGLGPSQVLLVQKDPHQLWDGEGWVGVVELYGHLLGWLVCGRE